VDQRVDNGCGCSDMFGSVTIKMPSTNRYHSSKVCYMCEVPTPAFKMWGVIQIYFWNTYHMCVHISCGSITWYLYLNVYLCLNFINECIIQKFCLCIPFLMLFGAFGWNFLLRCTMSGKFSFGLNHANITPAQGTNQTKKNPSSQRSWYRT
jgi:hypothetical protein